MRMDKHARGGTPETAAGEPRNDRTIHQLRQMLRDYRRQGRRFVNRDPVVATGVEQLDSALPNGGLPNGAVTEILSGTPGIGAMSFALRIAGRAAPDQRPIVLIDGADDFYPPAARRLGLHVDQLVVVRPRHGKDAVWAADQCLRCPAVAAVVARLDRLETGPSRRLQLAAESTGSLGLILRPQSDSSRSFAAVRIEMKAMAIDRASTGGGPVQVTLVKVREGTPAGPFVVGLDDETGFVPLHSMAVDRSSGDRQRRVGA
jgi:protein ImuA